MDSKPLEQLIYDVIGAAYEVRKQLGPFLYEETYERALQVELNLRGIHSLRQFKLPVVYKGTTLQDAYKVDLMVENVLPVELKTQKVMGGPEIHQILSYMTFGKFKYGLLMNFAADDFTRGYQTPDNYLDKGIYRFIH